MVPVIRTARTIEALVPLAESVGPLGGSADSARYNANAVVGSPTGLLRHARLNCGTGGHVAEDIAGERLA
jgi:hypothetical protein